MGNAPPQGPTGLCNPRLLMVPAGGQRRQKHLWVSDVADGETETESREKACHRATRHGFLLKAMVTMLTRGWLGTILQLRALHALFGLILIGLPPGPTLQQRKQRLVGGMTCLRPPGFAHVASEGRSLLLGWISEAALGLPRLGSSDDGIPPTPLSPPLLASPGGQPTWGGSDAHTPQTEGPHVSPKPGVSSPAAEAPQSSPYSFWGRQDVQGLGAPGGGSARSRTGRLRGCQPREVRSPPARRPGVRTSNTRFPTFGHIFYFLPQSRSSSITGSWLGCSWQSVSGCLHREGARGRESLVGGAGGEGGGCPTLGPALGRVMDVGCVGEWMDRGTDTSTNGHQAGCLDSV